MTHGRRKDDDLLEQHDSEISYWRGVLATTSQFASVVMVPLLFWAISTINDNQIKIAEMSGVIVAATADRITGSTASRDHNRLDGRINEVDKRITRIESLMDKRGMKQ